LPTPRELPLASQRRLPAVAPEGEGGQFPALHPRLHFRTIPHTTVFRDREFLIAPVASGTMLCWPNRQRPS
jgi:hypothetical protein